MNTHDDEIQKQLEIETYIVHICVCVQITVKITHSSMFKNIEIRC